MELTRRTRRSLPIAALALATALAGCADAGVEAGSDTATAVTSSPAPVTADTADSVDDTGQPEPGEDETAAASITLEEWQERLEDVCVRSDEALIGADPLDEVAFGNAVIAALAVRVDGLRSLPRPAGYEAEVEALLGRLDAVMALHEESGAAVAMAELVGPESATAAEVERLIAELGIEDCGEAAAGDPICARTPPELVAAVLGQAPEPEPMSQLGARGCLWEAGDDRLAVQTGPIEVYPQALDFFRTDGLAVAGVGDEAYLVDGFSSVTGGSTRGSTLWVVAGDAVYGVGAIVAGEAVEQDTLLAVAAALLAGN